MMGSHCRTPGAVFREVVMDIVSFQQRDWTQARTHANAVRTPDGILVLRRLSNAGGLCLDLAADAATLASLGYDEEGGLSVERALPGGGAFRAGSRSWKGSRRPMSHDPSQWYQVGETEGVSTVTVHDPQLLLEGKETFYHLADRPAGAAGPHHVVLNLQNLRHFQSAMLAVLINFQKRVRESGGDVKVCCIDPDVYKVFLLTKMDQIFDIRKTEQEAVAACRSKGPSWISKIFGN